MERDAKNNLLSIDTPNFKTNDLISSKNLVKFKYDKDVIDTEFNDFVIEETEPTSSLNPGDVVLSESEYIDLISELEAKQDEIDALKQNHSSSLEVLFNSLDLENNVNLASVVNSSIPNFKTNNLNSIKNWLTDLVETEQIDSTIYSSAITRINSAITTTNNISNSISNVITNINDIIGNNTPNSNDSDNQERDKEVDETPTIITNPPPQIGDRGILYK